MRPIRAIIYGVGRVGTLAARLMVEQGIDVVGAVNRPGPKTGRDLGKLAGLAKPLGIEVEDDADPALSRFRADAALVSVGDDMASMYPIYRNCLENGLNVVTVGAHASHPWRIAPQITADLDRTARRHNVTMTGSGNQDFFMVNLASLATGISHRIDSITHRSLTDVNGFGPEVADIAHVGRTPEDCAGLAAAETEEPMSVYTTFWDNLASDLGLTITHTIQTTEAVVRERPVHCRSRDSDIPAGRVVGVAQKLDIETLEGVDMRGEYVLKVCPPEEPEYKTWSLRGEPDLDIRLDRLDAGFTTTSQAVNRIADVVNAEPGYITLERLPKLRYHPGRAAGR